MKAYLDASVLVPLFLDDPFSARADGIVKTAGLDLIVSDWAALELSSVIARRVRIQALTLIEADSTLADFDLWCSQSTLKITAITQDILTASRFVRRFDLTLRGPDAIHIAAAQRLGATLFTFDAKMTAAAEALAVAVEG